MSVTPLKKTKNLDLKLHLFQAANNYSFSLKELISGTLKGSQNLKKRSHLIWTVRLSSSLVWRALARRGRTWAGEPAEDRERQTRWWKRGIHPWEVHILTEFTITPVAWGLCRPSLLHWHQPACSDFAVCPHLSHWRSHLLRPSDTGDVYKKGRKMKSFWTHCVLWSCEMPQGIFQTNPNRPWDETSASSAGGRSSSDDLRFLLGALPCEMTAAYRFCRSPWKFRTSCPSEHSRGRVWGGEEERDRRIEQGNFIQYPKLIKSEITRTPPKKHLCLLKK